MATTFPKVSANQLDAVLDFTSNPTSPPLVGALKYRVVVLDENGKLPALDGSQLTNVSTGPAGSVTSVNATTTSAGALSITGGPVTSSGILVFAVSPELDGIAGLTTTGLVQRTGTGTYTAANLTSAQVIAALGFIPGSSTGSVTSVAASGGSTGLTFSGSPITVSGTLTLSGTLGIANGGTGQTTAANAINALLPAQTGNTGKVLTTNGTASSWTSSVTSVAATGSTGLVVTGSPITSSGTLTLTLGAELQGLSSLFTTGFVRRVNTATYSAAPLNSAEIVAGLGYTPGQGTVTNITFTAGTGIQIFGSPITSSGTIAIGNTGVTSLAAGSGISVSAATGGVTVSAANFNSSTAGIVPASGGGTSTFLRADGTWSPPPSGAGSVTSIAVTSGNGAISVSGSPITVSGTINITANLFTAGAAGVVPASGGSSANFLRADGVWTSPPTGAGTVTSVNAVGSTGLSVSGGPITSSGTLSFTLGTELQGLSTLSANGFVQKTGVGSYTSAALTSAQVVNALGYTPGQGTVTSVAGTSNQVIVSGPTGGVTFSLPQSISTGNAPQFAGLTLTGAMNFVNNVWNTSNDGQIRMYFATNADTYLSIPGGSFHIRNAGGTDVFLLDQSGNLSMSGNLLANGNVTAFSDARLKTNIEPISNAVDKVLSLTGITYTRKDTNAVGTGLIAQDVQKVLPQAVLENEDGYLSVAYGNLVGLLVEAIKELNAKVELLTAGK